MPLHSLTYAEYSAVGAIHIMAPHGMLSKIPFSYHEKSKTNLSHPYSEKGGPSCFKMKSAIDNISHLHLKSIANVSNSYLSKLEYLHKYTSTNHCAKVPIFSSTDTEVGISNLSVSELRCTTWRCMTPATESHAPESRTTEYVVIKYYLIV